MNRRLRPHAEVHLVILASSVILVALIVIGTSGPSRAETPETVGHPLAPGILKLVENEVTTAIQRRGVSSTFQQFRSYARTKLSTTDGPRTGSEVTGNCRLLWYDHLLRNPIKAPTEAEQFTRQLHGDLQDDHQGLDRALVLARSRMDLLPRRPRSFEPPGSPQQALQAVRQALSGAQVGYASALSTLTPSEIGELTGNLYSALVSQNNVGHTLRNHRTGRRLCDLLEKVNRNGLYEGIEALVPLTDPELLEQLRLLDGQTGVTVAGVTGGLLNRIVTPAGTILVGGRGPNTYDLDAMATLSAVIDVGGDDTYREGTVSHKRPVLLVIDLEGNDSYRGSKPGIQGSAILGISMLLDIAGSDTYQAKDVAQASALGGAGILIDYAGSDVYHGTRRVQGQAFGGIGILIDRRGNDRYHGALWTQGMGGPLGFAVLDDLEGNDTYYTGGMYYDDYEETPGYDGWGQGVGAGPRGVANGGIGVILDGGGDDIYEFDYLSHGGGYWLGLGFARDFGGNDQRLGATRKTFHGGQRTERRYQRFGTGFGCHYSVGFCFDDDGNDAYGGTIMGLGHAWDCSVGGLYDLGGEDRYESTGGLTQGSAHQAGMAVLFDYRGDDSYRGTSQGNAPGGISYHPLPQCGGNFSFVIDYGGTDSYGCRAKNNKFSRRGGSGGFIIDRPSPEETISEKTANDTSGEKTPKS